MAKFAATGTRDEARKFYNVFISYLNTYSTANSHIFCVALVLLFFSFLYFFSASRKKTRHSLSPKKSPPFKSQRQAFKIAGKTMTMHKIAVAHKTVAFAVYNIGPQLLPLLSCGNFA